MLKVLRNRLNSQAALLFGVDREDIEENFDFKIYPFSIRFLIKSSQLLVQILPLLKYGKFKSFNSLSQEELYVFVEKIESSGVFTRGIYLLAIFPFLNSFKINEGIEQPKEIHPLSGKTSSFDDIDVEEAFDYIVIGSGAGGAPVSFKLAEAGYKVAIIERGGILQPLNARKSIQQFYMNAGLLGSINSSIVQVSVGNAVGGTTPLNLGTMLRPWSGVMESWVKDFNLLDDFKQIFIEIEQRLGVRDTTESELSTSDKVFYDQVSKLPGESRLLPHNFRSTTDQFFSKNSYPAIPINSMDRSYLVSAVEAGAKIFAGVEVQKVSEKNEFVAIQVCDRNTNQKKRLRANKLIIAAGAIQTPALIKSNKLGDKHKQAGDYLRLHPATTVYAYFPNIKHNHGIPQGMYYKHPQMPNTLFEGARIPKEMSMVTFGLMSSEPGFWLKNYDNCLNMGVFLQEESYGKVVNILDNQLITCNFNQTEIEQVVEGIKFIARTYFDAGATRVLLPIAMEGNEIYSVEELDKVDTKKVKAWQLNFAAFHPSGTAGLGRLVDSKMQLIGSKRIYISDASILPDTPGVNPQLTIMAFSVYLSKVLLNNSLTNKSEFLN